MYARFGGFIYLLYLCIRQRVIKRLVAQSQEFFESNLMQNVELRTVSYS